MQKTNYSLISLGCARAQVDSETMVNDLNHGGFTLVPGGSTESIMILNTCRNSIQDAKRYFREKL